MSFPIKPMAAILVARGQGEMAVSSPSRKAVKAGVVLLSNKDCNHSMDVYFSSCRIFCVTFALNVSGAERAFAKAYSVRFSVESLPFFHFVMKSEDHVISYLLVISSFSV